MLNLKVGYIIDSLRLVKINTIYAEVWQIIKEDMLF